MEIVKYDAGSDSAALEKFKADEWPGADLEHFQDQQPDFSKSQHTLLAKDQDAIIGYIIFTVDAGITWLESVIVAKARRGKGIATALVNEAEQIAKSLGSHKIWLETGSDWQARPLYEKLGYKVRAVLPNHYGHREFVLMDKEL